MALLRPSACRTPYAGGLIGGDTAKSLANINMSNCYTTRPSLVRPFRKFPYVTFCRLCQSCALDIALAARKSKRTVHIAIEFCQVSYISYICFRPSAALCVAWTDMFARCGITVSRIAKRQANRVCLHSMASLAGSSASFSDVSAAAAAVGSKAAETHALWSFKHVDAVTAKEKLRAASEASSKEQSMRGA